MPNLLQKAAATSAKLLKEERTPETALLAQIVSGAKNFVDAGAKFIKNEFTPNGKSAVVDRAERFRKESGSVMKRLERQLAAASDPDVRARIVEMINEVNGGHDAVIAATIMNYLLQCGKKLPSESELDNPMHPAIQEARLSCYRDRLAISDLKDAGTPHETRKLEAGIYLHIISIAKAVRAELSDTSFDSVNTLSALNGTLEATIADLEKKREELESGILSEDKGAKKETEVAPTAKNDGGIKYRHESNPLIVRKDGETTTRKGRGTTTRHRRPAAKAS